MASSTEGTSGQDRSGRRCSESTGRLRSSTRRRSTRTSHTRTASSRSGPTGTRSSPGWKKYKDVHTVQFAALKKFRFESRELEVHVLGDVAWVADRPHWQIETRAGEKVESDVRITAVLGWDAKAKRWLVEQWHVSSGLKERLHEY